MKQPPHRKVSPDPAENALRSDQERLANLEHDIYVNLDLSFLIYNTLEEMGPVREFVETEMTRKKAARDFWVDISKKVAVAGIWSTFLLVGSALVYAVTTWIKATKGG